MRPTDFNEGDNFHTPFISGYEILMDRFLEHMNESPEDYDPEVIALFQKCYGDLIPTDLRKVHEYIDEWCWDMPMECAI